MRANDPTPLHRFPTPKSTYFTMEDRGDMSEVEDMSEAEVALSNRRVNVSMSMSLYKKFLVMKEETKTENVT